jgi:hypothetical protein
MASSCMESMAGAVTGVAISPLAGAEEALSSTITAAEDES